MWKLEIAIHRGTLMSRDIADTQFFKSKKKALKKFNEDKKCYEGMGCKIWYAYLVDKNGNKTLLEENGYER